ncbi:MAG: chorismate synthase [Rhodobacteraceae bacterium]|nr:chorismate synthase [Paracoccaceae bacterium]MCY4249104.1 chorismate synthase [Paracoccaceae bacterium]MCY4309677.1 chorismate synthase [Paracoccaceae bacterium]
MSINTIGRLLKLGTWGESHGPAIGAILDGCPPGIEINESMIQHCLDRRRPGQNKYTTQRREEDKVEILSGVFDGKTTGTPIQMLIWNKDQRSKDYTDIREKFRPGHADLTYWHKYGNRDYRGGGRSSARETASRVAAGGVARAILQDIAPSIGITGYMTQIGKIPINRANFDSTEIEQNHFWCPDASIKHKWADYIMDIRKEGDSIGSMVEVCASGVPPGIGSPLYAKLDSELASAMMTINAVKSVEIGSGVGVVDLRGSENNDEINLLEDGQKIEFGSNNSGGILGGISTGQDIIVRIAIKPASSILIPKKSVTVEGIPAVVATKGRHDPCVGIRAVPVAEAMVALVLADQLLIHRGQIGEISDYSFTGD